MRPTPSLTRRAASWPVWLTVFILVAACGEDAPTGVSRSDLEGIWTGDLDDISLLGRTLSGSVDWIFSGSTFELRFFDQPAEQAERISGTWDFSGGQLVLELGSSFPIGSDVGATDTTFVSILGNELSMRTQGRSDILLRLSARSTAGKTASKPSVVRPDPPVDILPPADTSRHPARHISRSKGLPGRA